MPSNERLNLRPGQPVRHADRPELGIGYVMQVVKGKPPVAVVRWPEAGLWGHYLMTELQQM